MSSYSGYDDPRTGEQLSTEALMQRYNPHRLHSPVCSPLEWAVQNLLQEAQRLRTPRTRYLGDGLYAVDSGNSLTVYTDRNDGRHFLVFTDAELEALLAFRKERGC